MLATSSSSSATAAASTTGYGDMKVALAALSKECQTLWEENKDMQARFVNELAELQRFQLAINQLEQEQRLDQLNQARQSMCEMQRRASNLYEQLTERRIALTKRLNDGVHQIAAVQNNLIAERLLDWKTRQKLAQIGVSFEQRDLLLDDIQQEFEALAENNWQLRTFTCWQLDLLRRSPQLSDNTVQSHLTSLSSVLETLTKLLCMLVSQSFVVAVQPEPVLKTQHKFVAEVRLLIGDRLGIKQNLINANVTVKIIAEEEARALSIGQLSEKDIKTVGSISNDFEKLTLDEKGHMAAKFNNSKLTRIAHRKPPPKGGGGGMQDPQSATTLNMLNAVQCNSPAAVKLLPSSPQQQQLAMVAMCATPPQPGQTATDQKYALLFHITPFQLGNLGKFDVWTLSLPLMVTVHGSQDCDAQGVILWQRAFSSVNRCSTPMSATGANQPDNGGVPTAVSWQDLSQVLRHKFSLFTGAHRHLSDSDLAYLAEKLGGNGGGLVDNNSVSISFQRFAKQNLRDDVNFSFWEWFFLIMQLIKQKLLKFWDEGWLVGFISKQDASQRMLMAGQPTFLLRFSDTQTGAVSIGFVCEDEGVKVPFHLAPFTIKDLDQLSLAQRIASCPQLRDIRYLYPDIDKEEMLKCFESGEDQRFRRASESPTTGYIQSEIVMVAKTGNSKLGGGASSAISECGSPQIPNHQGGGMHSNSGKALDWSPGDFQAHSSNSIEMSDEQLVSLLSHSQLESVSVESLLGAGFRPPHLSLQQPHQPQLQHQHHQPQQQQQQQMDLSSFMVDASFSHAFNTVLGSMANSAGQQGSHHQER